MLSVNTNVGAMVALQNLNETNSEMAGVQQRINTGLKIASAKDNGGIYAIAQSMRADVSSLGAVSQSLNRAKSVVDVALAAGQSISDILVQMKEKAVSAADVSNDATARDALNEDFVALRKQIASIITNAQFNGNNLINAATGITAIASPDGTSKITIPGENLSLGGSNITIAATGVINTMTKAAAMITTVSASLTNVNKALARLGSASKRLDTQLAFNTKVTDALTAGIGNLVDADLAVESAKLQALQVKQQLGVQALSIANGAPRILQSLFQ